MNTVNDYISETVPPLFSPMRFRGYFSNTTELLDVEDPKNGDVCAVKTFIRDNENKIIAAKDTFYAFVDTAFTIVIMENTYETDENGKALTDDDGNIKYISENS